MGFFSRLAGLFNSNPVSNNEADRDNHIEFKEMEYDAPVMRDFEEATYYESSTSVESIDAPEPCGFDLNHILVHRERSTDRDTGEVFRDKVICTLGGSNFQKVKDDLFDIAPIADKTVKYASQWLLLSRWMEDIDIFQAPGEHGVLRLNGTLEVCPLTNKGNIKKYPIIVHLDIVDRSSCWKERTGEVINLGNDSLICHLHYLKDGTIGKAMLVTWCAHVGVKCELGMVKGNLAILRVERVGQSKDDLDQRWERIYDRNNPGS